MDGDKKPAQEGSHSAEDSVPSVSVIVVNYNGGDYLARCTASLARQTFPSFETILVDNASTDGSLDEIAERPARLTILRETENHGFAKGNNLGAARAQGRWIALLNPDAEADPDWLAELMRAAEQRPTHRMVACLQLAMDAPDRLDGAGDCYLAYGFAWRGGFGHPASDAPRAGECFGPCGAAALYPRDVFLAAGGFDERYFCYHEDVDLAFRLRLMGERCQFEPRARIRHAGSAITGRSSAFAVFHGVRNGVWTYLKNMPAPLLLLTAPVWIAGTLALLARGAVTGRFKATWSGLIAALRNLPAVLRDRSATQRLRRASLGDIARRLTWNPLRFLGRQIDVRPFDRTSRARQASRG